MECIGAFAPIPPNVYMAESVDLTFSREKLDGETTGASRLSVNGPLPLTPVTGVQRMASPPIVPNRLDKNKNRTHAAMSREF